MSFVLKYHCFLSPFHINKLLLTVFWMKAFCLRSIPFNESKTSDLITIPSSLASVSLNNSSMSSSAIPDKFFTVSIQFSFLTSLKVNPGFSTTDEQALKMLSTISWSVKVIAQTNYCKDRKVLYPYEAIFLVTKSLRVWISYDPGWDFTLWGSFQRY